MYVNMLTPSRIRKSSSNRRERGGSGSGGNGGYSRFAFDTGYDNGFDISAGIASISGATMGCGNEHRRARGTVTFNNVVRD